MLTEAQKAVLVDHLQKTVNWSYPLSGENAGDYNPGTGIYIYRAGEPVRREYPAVKIEFLPRSAMVSNSLSHVLSQYSGNLVYGYAELEPVIFTVYTHQICEGTSYRYHGKIIADTYIRRIETYIRQYWPKKLQTYEAYIKESLPFTVTDISSFLEGTETQGFELTMHLATTNKWTYKIDGVADTGFFIDATFEQSGAGDSVNDYLSVSGTMYSYESGITT